MAQIKQERVKEQNSLTADAFFELTEMLQAAKDFEAYKKAAVAITKDMDIIVCLWDVLRVWPFRRFREETELSQVKFARRFVIPRRSIENWESEVRNCPIYVKIYIADGLGLLPERRI